tara:strand:- start:62 stop:412 length:351 start_codon:yes stop_codon:yes gene_type:complete
MAKLEAQSGVANTVSILSENESVLARDKIGADRCGMVSSYQNAHFQIIGKELKIQKNGRVRSADSGVGARRIDRYWIDGFNVSVVSVQLCQKTGVIVLGAQTQFHTGALAGLDIRE